MGTRILVPPTQATVHYAFSTIVTVQREKPTTIALLWLSFFMILKCRSQTRSLLPLQVVTMRLLQWIIFTQIIILRNHPYGFVMTRETPDNELLAKMTVAFNVKAGKILELVFPDVRYSEAEVLTSMIESSKS